MSHKQRSILRLRRSIPTLSAIAALIVTLATSTPAANADPGFVTNPASYVNTLAGTGTGGQVVGYINNFPGPAKAAKKVTLKASAKGKIKVKIAKKYTKKKSIKVRAVFTPSDTANVIGAQSATKTVKAKK